MNKFTTIAVSATAAVALAYSVAQAATTTRQAAPSTTMIAKCRASIGLSASIKRDAAYCTRMSLGKVRVGFNRSVRGCAVVANVSNSNLYDGSRAAMASVSYLYEDEKSVVVETYRDDGGRDDRSFMVVVAC